jgi:hypothetical protein
LKTPYKYRKYAVLSWFCDSEGIYLLSLSYNERKFLGQFLSNQFLDVEEQLEDLRVSELDKGVTLEEEIFGLLGTEG